MILTIELSAKMLISPIDAMKAEYGEDVDVIKQNIMVKKEQGKIIQKNARVKLNSKIFRIFKAVKAEKIVGYGILINRKVRSKNAVVLYLISSDAQLLGIEIIAFNEPLEYLPSKQWKAEFENVSTENMLRLSREVPTITGATLSAQTITDGSRLAFAFYNEILKGKK